MVLDAGEYGRDAFGQVVVARDFGDALESRLQDAHRVTRYRPARFVGIDDTDPDARGIRIVDANGERTLSARLLVGADGTRSAVRLALDIGADESDYAQTLFVARLRSARAPDGTAYERFGDDGPTALLPRPDRHFGVVHAVPTSLAASVEALGDDAFLARLQAAFGWRVGRLVDVGARSVYRATSVCARAQVAQRAVLVGNSAQTLHPIGAQGFNLGLRDALTLAELIEGQADPGADALLAAYVERRRADRERTLAFSDGLARITANPGALVRPLRAFGLLAVDGVASLQASVVGGAMGYRGDVPRLCRPPA